MGVLLLSGGLDSAVCLALLRPTWALAVNYGQPHAAAELTCAHRLATTYKAELVVSTAMIPSAPGEGDPAMLWPGRNLVLLSLAAALGQVIGATEVIIGANLDDQEGYPDCRPEFFAAAATAMGVRIDAPLITLSKPEIGAEARRLGVPIAQTWSCYYPSIDGSACGSCDACAGRAEALA